jgi:hypothetical protein
MAAGQSVNAPNAVVSSTTKGVHGGFGAVKVRTDFTAIATGAPATSEVPLAFAVQAYDLTAS